METIEQLTAERDGWKQTALFHHRNEEYYRSLVVSIGKMIGPAAFTSDDGSVQDSVLCAKVPELVATLLDKPQTGRTDVLSMSSDHTHTTKSDVAWLIEKVQSARSGGPEYWSATDHDGDRNIYGWDGDVNHAMRFGDQKAAQAYIDVFAIEAAVAVEHAWV